MWVKTRKSKIDRLTIEADKIINDLHSVNADMIGNILSRITALEQKPKTIVELEKYQEEKDFNSLRERLNYFEDGFRILYDLCKNIFYNNFVVKHQLKSDINKALDDYYFLRNEKGQGDEEETEQEVEGE